MSLGGSDASPVDTCIYIFLQTTITQPYRREKRLVEWGQWLLDKIQDITT